MVPSFMMGGTSLADTDQLKKMGLLERLRLSQTPTLDTIEHLVIGCHENDSLAVTRQTLVEQCS
ncbi:hypothetical protein LG302_08950 [Halomonas organivorans]